MDIKPRDIGLAEFSLTRQLTSFQPRNSAGSFFSPVRSFRRFVLFQENKFPFILQSPNPPLHTSRHPGRQRILRQVEPGGTSESL